MTTDRGTLGSHLRLSATAAATGWVAMLSWKGFTGPPYDFLTNLLAVALVIAASGALARWRRVPAGLVLILQLALGSGVVCLYIAGTPYPGHEFWESLRAALDDANFYAPPVPSTDQINIAPLLLLGGFVAVLLVDLLACTLRRVPLAGLPLLTVYSVPVSMLDAGISWVVFGATAFGFLLLLFLQEQEHVGRWGRSLDGSAAPTRRSDAVRGSAVGVGAVAVVVAIVSPIAVPSLDLTLFDVGKGNGPGDEISIVNPLVDLRRDLDRGADIDLIRLTGVNPDEPKPTYLRISVLNRFSDNEFSSGDRDVPAQNTADGSALPPFPGTGPNVQVTENLGYRLDIGPSFDSRWLPTLESTVAVDAPGDWRYDAATRDFLASDDGLTTRDLSYSLTSAQLTYSDAAFQVTAGAASEVSPEVLDLPGSLAGELRPFLDEAFAASGLTGSSSRYEEAVALQRWFRNLGGFRYDIAAVDSDQQVGSDQLLNFLRASGRSGYCEQFAAAMAIMARAVGVPSRVAVGFLEPDEVSPGTWVYSSHDLHAWPELFFPGAGWVRFDPTPSGRVPGSLLPAYTTVRQEPEQAPTSTATSSGLATSAPTERDPRPTARPSQTPDQADANQGGSAFGDVSWLVVLAVLAAVLLLALLIVGPRLLRRTQRGRRLRGGPESAWEELRATALDLGLPWPEGRSPHEVELGVAEAFGRPGADEERPARGAELNPTAVAALGRIVRQLERLRYAASWAGTPGELADDTLTCVEALTSGSTSSARRRAVWLPRSVLQRRRVAAEVETHEESDAELVGTVEHL